MATPSRKQLEQQLLALDAETQGYLHPERPRSSGTLIERLTSPSAAIAAERVRECSPTALAFSFACEHHSTLAIQTRAQTLVHPPTTQALAAVERRRAAAAADSRSVSRVGDDDDDDDDDTVSQQVLL